MNWLHGDPKKLRQRPAKLWQLEREHFERLDEETRQTVIQFAGLELRDLHDAYEQTGNSVHALRAWQIARATGTDAPEWVATFFDECAAGKDIKPHGNADADKQYSQYEGLRRAFAAEVHAGCQSKEAIYAKLAERFGTSKAAVKKRILSL